MVNTVIKMNNVSKVIKNTPLLSHFNMNVYENDIYGFIGENGAGKSTTMKIIMSLIKESEGTVELFESPYNQLSLGRIGAIIESPAFYPYMSAYDNLAYYIRYKGIVEKNSIDKVLKMVGLDTAKNKKYKNYSLGMKQRLGLALSLIGNPDLLILDEPLNGLDPQGIVELRETLRFLNQKHGITMIVSSHILDELSLIATRYGFIHKGSMIEEIDADQLHEKLRQYIILEVDDVNKVCTVIEQRLDSKNYEVIDDKTIYLYDFIEESSKVLSLLIQEGLLISKMNISNLSLEDYYLQLIKGAENRV